MGVQGVDALMKLLTGSALLLLFYPVRWTLRCLSWPRALRVGTLLATIHAHRRRDRLYRQIEDGIRAVWQDELTTPEIAQLVRRNLVIRYQHLIDGFFYHTLDEALTARLVPCIDGRSHLDRALAQGKGAILLASHFGSLGLLLAGLVYRGYRLNQIFTLTPQPHYRTWRCMERAIMHAKLRCWPRDRMGFTFWRPGVYLRPLYRQLCEGAIVVLYGDGARGQEFTQVNFLGHRLALSTGPFRIAARAQVPLLPAFIVRQADDRHRVTLEAPIVLRDDAPDSLQRGAEHYAALLSRYVRAHPDHWFTWARLRRRHDAHGIALELAAPQVERAHFYALVERREA
jgi:phosphatidylinositol dimannoside acyltransferase